ncbi:hypothetical protein JCM24511_03969 [Saitozyma sp. JCM 24511]|nr:hypothetical protein JCM24511_03969 [Saitozyma sp. JCM 24511]
MAEEIKLAGGRGQWAEGAWMKDTMVDHVLLRWPGRPSRSTGGELESSPWVSACGNLDWAIWEIAKRLSQGLSSVRLAIIRQEHHDFDPDRLNGAHARIRTHKIGPDGAPQPASAAMSGRIRQLTVAPAVVLDRHIPRIISTRKKEVYSSAAARAREAQEVLVYGRIFSESILADPTCTRNDLPFELPAKFWRPTWHPSPPGLTGWLARLRWDPRMHTFTKAREGMGRRYDTGAGWKGQPVKPSPWQWPPQGSPPSRRKGVTRGTIPAVDPHLDVHKITLIPKLEVPTTSQQAGFQSGFEASSNVVAKNGPTENRSSDGVHSQQNSESRKTIKLGAPAEKKGSQSGGTTEPSSKSPTRGPEIAEKPGRGKKMAQDKVKSKPKPARRPLEPIEEGVLVEFTS